MRQKYRLFIRGTVYWVQDNESNKQSSLGTRDRDEAKRLFAAKNEAHRQPVINLQIARAYLMVSDPEAATRTWQFVMEEIVKLKHGATRVRWLVAIKDKALNGIRNLPVLETRAQDFLRAIENGKISTNIHLRRIHNFALSMNWLPVAEAQPFGRGTLTFLDHSIDREFRLNDPNSSGDNCANRLSRTSLVERPLSFLVRL